MSDESEDTFRLMDNMAVGLLIGLCLVVGVGGSILVVLWKVAQHIGGLF